MNTLIKYRGRIILCLIIVVNALLLSACADWDIFLDMAEDWAAEKSIIDGSGEINYVNLGREITDDTIDGIVGGSKEAPLQTGSVVDDIRKADDLAQQGAVSGDVTLIEDAISLRPNDWAYTEMRSAVYLAQGDFDAYLQSTSNSNQLVRNSILNGTDCIVAYRSLYQHRVKSLQQQLDAHPNDIKIATALDGAKDVLENPEDMCPEWLQSD